ncbi:hypothetical protein EVAR_51717_1 [Eumeta japonica]|uniref:Uncharacterized protein n=1 Tax=Eumeta variegata TaxID=151549 RepID=A0A4C1XKM3_EUMVA|nr:hypothetical protein EVAR_51717_1 [Eumeta japonica]
MKYLNIKCRGEPSPFDVGITWRPPYLVVGSPLNLFVTFIFSDEGGNNFFLLVSLNVGTLCHDEGIFVVSWLTLEFVSMTRLAEDTRHEESNRQINSFSFQKNAAKRHYRVRSNDVKHPNRHIVLAKISSSPPGFASLAGGQTILAHGLSGPQAQARLNHTQSYTV